MKRIRAAFIGSRGHFQMALDQMGQVGGFEIVAFSSGGDSVDPIIAWCTAKGHHPMVFEDYQRMLDQGGIDLLVVCGPFERHAEMCIAAIERDIHVLSEKPAALTLEDLAKLKKVSAAHPKALLAGMMFSRYEPGFFTGWKLVREGAIGDIRVINARKSYKRGNRPAYYENRETYGGTIPWVGSHAIDWMLWFSEQIPEAVYARHSTAANGDVGEMESSAICQFSFASGLEASISIDVLRPENAPTHGDDWMRIVGSNGVMEIRPDSVCLINAENDGTKNLAGVSKQCLVGDIFDHIREGKRCGVDTPSTLALTDACLRTRQSADERRVVAF